MQTGIQKRFQMLGLARQAVADDLVVPYYQPKVDLTSGTIVGFEALLRVRHPTRGILAPAQILPALDDVDIAADIGDRMITLVLADLRRWIDAGLHVGHIAVNAAAADFRRGNFADRLLEQLHRHHVPADHVQLEVTETVFLGTGTKYVETALRQLSESGVRIALDDFGTGYASLSHLQQFPIDILKIDRSFIRKMMRDRRDAAIVGAVIRLGRNLGLQVVAEGVETSEQAARLLEQECQIAQGYLFGKAMTAARVPGKCPKTGI
jgi:EAL domain-containing protein (putative c-di-GMP-specific phosphodiesterase class I)